MMPLFFADAGAQSAQTPLVVIVSEEESAGSSDLAVGAARTEIEPLQTSGHRPSASAARVGQGWFGDGGWGAVSASSAQNASIAEYGVPGRSTTTSDFERELLANFSAVERSLSDEAILDGFAHPGEDKLKSVLAAGESGRAMVQSAFVRHYGARPDLSAALLTCLGRCASGVREVELTEVLVLAGMGHRSAEVREAAITVVDRLRTPVLLGALHAHREEVGWLQRYVSKILSEADGR